MRPLLVPLAPPRAAYGSLANAIGADVADFEMRRFPDGESYVRLLSNPAGRTAWVYATLNRPDDKVVQLLFMAATLRDLGAVSVGLVAPYLPYLRQDQRFRPGEGLTSRYFAQMVSAHFDRLVTVDPHLHRYASLADVYDIPCTRVASAPALASWISARVDRPFLVGPDSESEQWVAAVAEAVGCPFVVLEKERHGDLDVDVSAASSATDLDRVAGRMPVVIDDIISTAGTMAKAINVLRHRGFDPPLCVGVHAVFAADAESRVSGAGCARVVTTNTLPHPTNAIDITDALAEAMGEG